MRCPRQSHAECNKGATHTCGPTPQSPVPHVILLRIFLFINVALLLSPVASVPTFLTVAFPFVASSLSFCSSSFSSSSSTRSS